MTDLIGDRPSPVMTDLIGHLKNIRQIDYLCEKPDAMKMTGVLLAAALVCASSHLPSHPAMYMNPDGTVPTIVLTNESGTTNTLRIDANRLLAPDLTFEALVFEKVGE